MEKKEKIGEQLQKKIRRACDTNDKGPEAREVTKEWGKKFLKDIEKIADEKKDWDKVYIKILAKKGITNAEIVSVVYGVTDFPPSPNWKNALYSYDRKKDEWRLEWLLPQAKEIAEVMLAHREGFDPFLIECIEKFMQGKLLGQ